MKKFLQLALVLVVSLVYTSNVNAATEQELIDYAAKYVSDSQLVLVKQYLSEYDVTSTEADQIIAKADEIVAIMNEANVTDVMDLSADQKKEAFSLAQEAAAVVGVSLTYDSSNKTIQPYKDGVALAAIPLSTSTLQKTGNDYTLYISISGIALVGIASLLARKLKNNA